MLQCARTISQHTLGGFRTDVSHNIVDSLGVVFFLSIIVGFAVRAGLFLSVLLILLDLIFVAEGVPHGAWVVLVDGNRLFQSVLQNMKGIVVYGDHLVNVLRPVS